MEFRPFNDSGSLQVQERLVQVPPTASVKGMFFQAIAEQMRRATGRAAEKSYVSFKDYPAREFITFCADAAERLHPGAPPREAVRRLGRLHYAAFKESSFGSVLLSLAGSRLHAALKALPSAYAAAGKGATANLMELGDRQAVVALRGCWDFPDCHEVGVFESVLEAFGHQGQVWVRPLTFSEVDLQLRW